MKNALSQILLRLPQELHEDLKRASQIEGLSLNQYCLYLLARHTHSKEAQKTQKAESLFQFLEQAQLLQKEFEKNKSPRKIKVESPQETPVSRYRHLYGSL